MPNALMIEPDGAETVPPRKGTEAVFYIDGFALLSRHGSAALDAGTAGSEGVIYIDGFASLPRHSGLPSDIGTAGPDADLIDGLGTVLQRESLEAYINARFADALDCLYEDFNVLPSTAAVARMGAFIAQLPQHLTAATVREVLFDISETGAFSLTIVTPSKVAVLDVSGRTPRLNMVLQCRGSLEFDMTPNRLPWSTALKVMETYLAE